MKVFKKVMAGLVLSLSMSAHAAIIDWEGTGVDFFSSWIDADTLRIEIDAEGPTAEGPIAGWADAVAIDSIAINGDWDWFNDDDITLAAIGTFGGAIDGSGLNEMGCQGEVLGGNHQCWSGLALLTDDMFFDFTFAGDAIFSTGTNPHLKVRFIDAYGEKVGSLLSTTVNIPEPAMISLLGAGLIGLGFARRRRRKT